MSDNYQLTEIGEAPIWVNPSARDRYLAERLAEIEDFMREDRDWINIGAANQDQQLSRGGLQYIGRIARLMYIQNPLVNRGVTVKADYVWGRGCNISAKDETINELIQEFLDDPRNQVEFTSQPSRIQKEVELQTDGNIFFAFIVHPITGRVRVRSIPCDEITDTITNPNDKKEVWFYKREWVEVTTNLETGETKTENKTAFYPDWDYRPAAIQKKIGKFDVINVPVYHVKIGGFSDWKFGVPEIFSSLNWAKSYTKFLSNWASLMQVYARFALKITTSGGKAGIDKAKEKIGTTISSTRRETNPPPAPGSSFVRSQSADGVTQADVDVVRTAGATTSAEDGRRLLLMVCAAFGIPETFLGDVSVGTLATSKSLDRPTELGFKNRQELWAYIYHAIIDFVMFCSVKAPAGKINKARIATIGANEYGEPIVLWQDDVNTHVDVDFPSIVEHDLQQYVMAVKTAATLDGATPNVLNDNRLLARMFLVALGENDVDEILDKLYPLDADGNPINPNPAPAQGTNPEADQLANDLMQAAQGVQEALQLVRESINELFTKHSTNGNGVIVSN